MQRAVRHLRHLPHLRRYASGGPMHYSERWSHAIRAESNVMAPDDAPASPLSENHEVGDGQTDFSNWVDKNEDVSTTQAVIGLGSVSLLCYAIYAYSGHRARASEPVFTLREFPNIAEDMPSYQSVDSVRH